MIVEDIDQTVLLFISDLILWADNQLLIILFLLNQ
jgi:hypothetical protein